MRNAGLTVLLLIFIGLSFLGMVDGIYLTYAHYMPGAADFCGIKPNFDCDVINTSAYSTMDGIINDLFSIKLYFPVPMGLLSALLFFGLFSASVFVYKDFVFKFKMIKITPGLVLHLSWLLLLVTMLFGFFLIYVQAEILKMWCLLCIALDIIIVSTLVTVWAIIRKRRKLRRALQTQAE